MQTNRGYLFLLSALLIAACSQKKKLDVPVLVPDFLAAQHNEFSGKLFFIGPEIDTANQRIVADCDCCASNLAFINDSVFVFESMCLEGDDYFKGTYSKMGDLLILKFHPLIVSHVHYPGPDMESTWEKETGSIHYSALNLSKLGSEWVIAASYEGNTDYGMSNRSIPVKTYLSDLKSAGVWNKLELK